MHAKARRREVLVLMDDSFAAFFEGGSGKVDQKAGDVELSQERYDGKELREANELKWGLFLERGLNALGKDSAAILKDRKSAAWKVMLAAAIKSHTSATNVWITGKLNMGISQAVSQNVGNFFALGNDQKDDYKDLIINLTT